MMIKPFAAIPGPKSYPVIGSLGQYLFGPYNRLKYHEALSSMHKEFGPLVKEKMGPGKDIVHVFDPEDIKTVYANEGAHPEIPPLQETTAMYRAQKNMSLGIGNTNGDEWYRLRSNSHQRMLRPRELHRYIPGTDQVARDFVTRIDKVKYSLTEEVTDLRTEVGLWNMEASGLLVFDKRIGCLEIGSDGETLARKMVEANATVFKLSGLLKLSMPIYKYVTTPKWRQMVKAEDLLYSEAIAMVDEAILKVKEEVEKGTLTDNSQGRFYFLSYLLSRPELSLRDVTIICLSVFLDGLSTTTPTALFCLYSLAVNPRVQQRLHREICDVIGPHDDVINPNDIAKMTYLKAFIKEVFRIWPNGTEVSRYTDKPMVLSGYQIPAGTHVDLNPGVHFKDAALFDKPDQLIPERWLKQHQQSPSSNEEGSRSTGDSKGKAASAEKKSEGEEACPAAAAAVASANDTVHPFLLTPFSHGTRMCAGRRFAEQHLHVLLINVIRNFELEYPIGEAMDQVYHTLLMPDRPVRVKFIRRTNQQN